jgi:hypothetical protein
MTTTENSELDALTAEPKALALASGLEIEIERLKTRQLFKFVKIVTSGAGGLLGSLNLSSEGDSSEFAGQLLALTLVAIPEAEDEAIDFIGRWCARRVSSFRPRARRTRPATRSSSRSSTPSWRTPSSRTSSPSSSS